MRWRARPRAELESVFGVLLQRSALFAVDLGAPCLSRPEADSAQLWTFAAGAWRGVFGREVHLTVRGDVAALRFRPPPTDWEYDWDGDEDGRIKETGGWLVGSALALALDVPEADLPAAAWAAGVTRTGSGRYGLGSWTTAQTLRAGAP